MGDIGGCVGGAVVPDRQVPMGVGLGEDAVEGLREIVLAVVDGHHEGGNVGHLSYGGGASFRMPRWKDV